MSDSIKTLDIKQLNNFRHLKKNNCFKLRNMINDKFDILLFIKSLRFITLIKQNYYYLCINIDNNNNNNLIS